MCNKETSGSPLNSLIDGNVGCVKCGAAMGKCDCWTKCKCGWLFEKDTSCRNPKCGGDPNYLPRAVAVGTLKL